MDALIVARKLDSLQRCLARVHDKCPATADALAASPDLQDIVVLNLSRQSNSVSIWPCTY